MRIFLNLKYKSKLLITYLIVGLLPIAIWSISFYVQSTILLKEEQSLNFTNTTNSIYETVNNEFLKINQDFHFIAQNRNATRILGKAYQKEGYPLYLDLVTTLNTLVNTILTLNPSINKIEFYTEGIIQNITRNFKSYDELPQNLYEKIHDSNDILWTSDENFIYLYFELFGFGSYGKSGIVSYQIDKDKFLNSFRATLPTDISIIIKDSLNTEVIALNPSNIDFNDSNNYMDEKAFTINGWTIETYASSYNLNVILKNTIIIVLSITLLSIALIGMLVTLFSNSINARVLDLKMKLKNTIASGFSTEIQSPYKDEFGDITNSIGSLVSEIRIMINEVYESGLKQKDAEIKALQSQINPHFLYNTLSIINWEAVNCDNSKIIKLVNLLSKFYRSTLNAGNNVTTIRNELENSKAYTDIQLIVHNNSFTVNYHVHDEILENKIPCIILQPIIENAIEHGILELEDRRGIINVNISDTEDYIIFEITDNGNGMTEDFTKDILTTRRSGYGLKNVNERLKLFFGEKYSMAIKSNQNIGTSISAKIPKHMNKH